MAALPRAPASRTAEADYNGYVSKILPTVEPSRAEIDLLDGPAVIEFGASWCGYCRAAQPLIASALAEHPGLRHIKIEDGKGRRLGRSFRVKLWPTLIFMSHGKEMARLIRPADSVAIKEAIRKITNRSSPLVPHSINEENDL